MVSKNNPGSFDKILLAQMNFNLVYNQSFGDWADSMIKALETLKKLHKDLPITKIGIDFQRDLQPNKVSLLVYAMKEQGFTIPGKTELGKPGIIMGPPPKDDDIVQDKSNPDQKNVFIVKPKRKK